MGDVVILEAAQNVDDSVDLSDISEKPVAEPFTLRRAAQQHCYVDEVDASRDDRLRSSDLGDLLQAGVRHRDLVGVRLDGAEGIVGRLCGSCASQGVEKRRLVFVGQFYDAVFEADYGLVL